MLKANLQAGRESDRVSVLSEMGLSHIVSDVLNFPEPAARFVIALYSCESVLSVLKLMRIYWFCGGYLRLDNI